jgi:hypothetical protein
MTCVSHISTYSPACTADEECLSRMFTPTEQAAWEAKRQEAYLASLEGMGNKGDESGSNVSSVGGGAGPSDDDDNEDKNPDQDEDEDEDQDDISSEHGNRHSNGKRGPLRGQAPSKKASAPDSDMETSEHAPEEEHTSPPLKLTTSNTKKGKQAKSSRKAAKVGGVGQARPRDRASKGTGNDEDEQEQDRAVPQASTKKKSKGRSTLATIKIPARPATLRASRRSNGQPSQSHGLSSADNDDGLPAPSEDVDMDNVVMDSAMDVDISPKAEDSDASEEEPVPYTNRAATANISMSGYRKYSLSIDAMNVLPDVPPIQYTPPPPSPLCATIPGKLIDVLALRDMSHHGQRKNAPRGFGPSVTP